MKKVFAIFVSVLLFASLSIAVVGCKEAPEQEAPKVEAPAAPEATEATPEVAPEAAPEVAPEAAEPAK
ncbi:MAG: hypothetical protein R6W75_14315 [Smithellaceae bacterium]